jgi:hypothetical protein
MIASYLAHIEHLLEGQRWEAARREASDLPQIAVALAHPQLRSSPERVRQWCQDWILADAECEHLCQLVSCESVPALALRRLQLHRLARTPPREGSTLFNEGLAAGESDAAQLSTTLVEATRRWYARSACHDATVQSNLARLAVLR